MATDEQRARMRRDAERMMGIKGGGEPGSLGRSLARDVLILTGEPDLAALLQQLQPLDEDAKERWDAKQAEEYEDYEPDSDLLPWLALVELNDDWRCGWQHQPDEATEWTIFADGPTPIAAAQALLALMQAE
jgi:hypothetical protein